MSSNEHFLEDDPEITGQQWVLLSFLSPENVLAKKDVYFFQQFLSKFEVNIKTKLMEEHLAKMTTTINDSLEKHALEFDKLDLSGVATTCRESKIRVDAVLGDIHEYVKKNINELTYDKLKESYDDYIYKNGTTLEDEFYQQNKFQTSIRGLKVRGIYGSKEEADAMSKKLIRIDPIFNIYNARVGKWLPWDPEPSRIKENVYAEDELNTLMKKYQENEEAREEFYREKKMKVKNRNVENTVGSSNNEVVNNDTNSMFNAVGDLALERKMNGSSI
jgi:hypothetical protein